MSVVENPALKAFVASLGAELTLAQVLIRRHNSGFELRHSADRDSATASLRQLKLSEVRQLAQYTAAGEFRPLKSSPDLQRCWRLAPANDAELESALNQLYPGALADWFAAQVGNPPVTNYREYTGRQSGMYRITTLLDDSRAMDVIKAVCDKSRCLKRRLWTVGGLSVDGTDTKSLIPCLEPCAVLMESARMAVRAAQQENPAPS